MKNEELISKISKELSSDLLKHYGNKLKSIILFGSYARGDNRPDSDMDIMVIFDCSKDEVMDYIDDISWISSDLSLDNDILISIVIRDKETFDNNLNILPFYQNVMNEGVALYGSI